MRRRLATLLMPIAVVSFARADTAPDAAPATQPDGMASMPATAPASLFDPARHMHVSEVRAGMKGYGLTVLSGTKIDRFDVEVISVLHNSFATQEDVVMIRCLGDLMQHYGPIAGCSGSPIYLYDDSGKARLIGAYAFGFDTAKDPIVGVQPIEYMLRLTKPPAGVDDTGTKLTADVPQTWSLLDSAQWRASLRDTSAVPAISSLRHGVMPSIQGMHPLSVPISFRGVSESTLDALRPMFRANGLEPLLAPGTATPVGENAPAIEPGSVLGAAVLSGDLELTALGTCTEVINGRAFGFGHPFNGEGATSIPMGSGSVALVMPTVNSSFKMGGIAGGQTGAIDMDGTSGIAGEIGAVAKTVPVTVEVKASEDASPRTFHYRAALHRTFTPLMVATALQSSVVAEQALPVEHTATYSVTLRFAGNRELVMANVASSLEGFDIARDTAWPISTMMNNPFSNIPLESVSAKIDIERGARTAAIESATPARPVYRPGEPARINVRLHKYKGETFVKGIDVSLPITLKDGDYAISIGDAASNLVAEATDHPELFAARNVDELFSTLTNLTHSVRNDALYVRLATNDEGLAIGRTSFAKLPPSRRAVLASAGRPDAAPTNTSTLTIIPMDTVVSGTADVTIHVKKKLP